MANEYDALFCQHIFSHFAEHMKWRVLRSSIPEQDPEEAANARVDLRVETDAGVFAIEHTKIGPYTAHEIDQSNGLHLERRINEVCWDEYFEGNLKVDLPIAIFEKYKVSDICKIIESGIKSTFSLFMKQKLYGDHTSPKRVIFDNIKIYFYFGGEGELKGKVNIGYQLESRPDLESRRIERIANIVPRKLEKLRERMRRGEKTLLMLEETNASLADERTTASAIRSVVSANEPVPDLVFYVDSSRESYWHIFPIYQWGEWDPGSGLAMNIQNRLKIRPMPHGE